MTTRYRSRFEFDFATYLDNNNIKFEYEPRKIKYVPKEKSYTPDFYLVDYDMFIETKGRFIEADRTKHKLIAKQHPDIDIRFMFQNPRVKLSKKSKATYADWCEKNDFLYCTKELPYTWVKKNEHK